MQTLVTNNNLAVLIASIDEHMRQLATTTQLVLQVRRESSPQYICNTRFNPQLNTVIYWVPDPSTGRLPNFSFAPVYIELQAFKNLNPAMVAEIAQAYELRFQNNSSHQQKIVAIADHLGLSYAHLLV